MCLSRRRSHFPSSPSSWLFLVTIETAISSRIGKRVLECQECAAKTPPRARTACRRASDTNIYTSISVYIYSL